MQAHFGTDHSHFHFGPGELNQPTEDCDDGNTLPGESCTGICKVEPYWECPNAGQPCELQIVCGNGRVEAGEVCDDDNSDDRGDKCTNSCKKIIVVPV